MAHISTMSDVKHPLIPMTVFGEEAAQGMRLLRRLSDSVLSPSQRDVRYDTQAGWRVYSISSKRYWVSDQLCGFRRAQLFMWCLNPSRIIRHGLSHFDLSALKLICDHLNSVHGILPERRLLVSLLMGGDASASVDLPHVETLLRSTLSKAGISASYQVKFCTSKAGDEAVHRALNTLSDALETSVSFDQTYPHRFVDDWTYIPTGEVVGENGEAWSISKPIAMLQTPVTLSLYRAVMGEDPPLSYGPLYPALGVSWFEAIKFCNTLSNLLELEPYYSFDTQESQVTLNDPRGLGIRLPTRAEWCYAASGGRSWPYAGSNLPQEVAWSAHNSGSKVHPVAQLQHNDYGIYDLSGNVWEWCQEGSRDHETPILCVGDHHPKWLLGGSWANHPWVFPIGESLSELPRYNDEFMGFRIVRNLSAQEEESPSSIFWQVLETAPSEGDE